MFITPGESLGVKMFVTFTTKIISLIHKKVIKKTLQVRDTNTAIGENQSAAINKIKQFYIL